MRCWELLRSVKTGSFGEFISSLSVCIGNYSAKKGRLGPGERLRYRPAPFVGMTRIRFEGLFQNTLSKNSQPIRAPLHLVLVSRFQKKGQHPW